MKTLHKLNGNWIITDDSIRGERGYNYNFGLSKIDKLEYSYGKHSTEWNCCHKITHSLLPLEGVEQLQLNQIPESIREFDDIFIETLAERLRSEINKSFYCTGSEFEDGIFDNGYISGFNKALELTKDKFDTIEETFRNFIRSEQLSAKWELYLKENNISLNPTSWNIEIENGKIELI